MSTAFAQLGLCAALLAGLNRVGIEQPTGVQARVIPLVLAGKDVLGQSATGTGKTLAYLLPLLQKIDPARRETQAIILAPTHELAMQIFRQIEMLAGNAGLPITAAPVIGQANIARQIEGLKAKPQIIVGSSGRILELIQKRKLVAHTVRTIVIDEADRLLDDDNWPGVRAVVKTTLRDRQILLLSATLTPSSRSRAVELAPNGELIAVTDELGVPPNIDHWYFVAERRDKIELLRKLAAQLRVGHGLVFVNNSEIIDLTVAKLNYHGLEAAGLYGSSTKTDRQKALADFRQGRIRLLVASDLAARGLDIPEVEHIFNLELPEDSQVYLHRAGRTGRVGRKGLTVSIITRPEQATLAGFSRTLKIRFIAKQLARGIIVDRIQPPIRPVRQKRGSVDGADPGSTGRPTRRGSYSQHPKRLDRESYKPEPD